MYIYIYILVDTVIDSHAVSWFVLVEILPQFLSVRGHFHRDLCIKYVCLMQIHTAEQIFVFTILTLPTGFL